MVCTALNNILLPIRTRSDTPARLLPVFVPCLQSASPQCHCHTSAATQTKPHQQRPLSAQCAYSLASLLIRRSILSFMPRSHACRLAMRKRQNISCCTAINVYIYIYIYIYIYLSPSNSCKLAKCLSNLCQYMYVYIYIHIYVAHAYHHEVDNARPVGQGAPRIESRDPRQRRGPMQSNEFVLRHEPLLHVCTYTHKY